MAKLSSSERKSNQHLTLIGNSKYLWLTGGQKYQIRVLSRLCKFYRLFKDIGGKINTAISDESSKESLPDDVSISERYAMYVIDRNDGKIKALEVPRSVVRAIANHAAATKFKPFDSQKGFDYLIQVEGTGKETRYTVTPTTETPLTNTEQELVKSKTERPVHELYKSDTKEQIKEKLYL